MKNLYAFELGRQRDLCLAEIIALFPDQKIIHSDKEIAIFEFPHQPDQIKIQKLQNQLGGTKKIIKILQKFELQQQPLPKPQSAEEKTQTQIQQKIEEFILTNFTNHPGKLTFAFSLYGKKTQSSYIKKLLNFSKKVLKSLKINSRFVNKNFRQNPKTSALWRSKILTKGFELNLIFTKNEMLLGHTVTIQNIDNYTKRDSYKPKRDPNIGMLPPKLAQIMINMAGEKTKTIFDPFCGTGTILMEGLLMAKNAIGSDWNTKMIEYSQVNLQWLQNEFDTKSTFRVFERDARFINKTVLPEKIDAIITEGYLGEMMQKPPTEAEMEVLFRDLANLHLNWLKAIHETTEGKCPIITCVIAYKNGNKIIHLPKFSELAEFAGYSVEKKYTYFRPDQIVARDIVILKPLNAKKY